MAALILQQIEVDGMKVEVLIIDVSAAELEAMEPGTLLDLDRISDMLEDMGPSSKILTDPELGEFREGAEKFPTPYDLSWEALGMEDPNAEEEDGLMSLAEFKEQLRLEEEFEEQLRQNERRQY